MQKINEAALVAFVFHHYHESAKTSGRVANILDSIGLAAPAMIDSLYIGFSDRSLGRQFPASSNPLGASVRGALRRMGLFRANGQELFWGCMIVPMLDTSGLIIGAHAFRLMDIEKRHELTPVSWVLDVKICPHCASCNHAFAV